MSSDSRDPFQQPPRRPLDYRPPEQSGGRKALRIIGITLLAMVGVVVLLVVIVAGTCALMMRK